MAKRPRYHIWFLLLSLNHNFYVKIAVPILPGLSSTLGYQPGVHCRVRTA